jgi:hypothetical protein
MPTVLSRLLLVALASASILLARKSLEYHERALQASQQISLMSVPQRWVRAQQLVSPRGLGRRPCPRPTYYQVRWLGAPGPRPIVGRW